MCKTRPYVMEMSWTNAIVSNPTKSASPSRVIVHWDSFKSPQKIKCKPSDLELIRASSSKAHLKKICEDFPDIELLPKDA